MPIVAIAPLLGWINVIALVLYKLVFDPVGPSSAPPSIVAAALWLAPLAWILVKWRASTRPQGLPGSDPRRR